MACELNVSKLELPLEVNNCLKMIMNKQKTSNDINMPITYKLKPDIFHPVMLGCHGRWRLMTVEYTESKLKTIFYFLVGQSSTQSRLTLRVKVHLQIPKTIRGMMKIFNSGIKKTINNRYFGLLSYVVVRSDSDSPYDSVTWSR